MSRLFALLFAAATLPAAAQSVDVNTSPARTPGASSDTQSAPDSRTGRDGSMGGEFKDLDRDGDGKLTKAEASGQAALQGRFVSLDENRDGHLTRAEFAAFESKDSRTGLGTTPSSTDEAQEPGTRR